MDANSVNTAGNTKIVLVGNQNCGKTTLFNYITGSNQYVGNWPGVTLDKVTGYVQERNIDVVDMPGLYALSPYSPEEIVTRDYLINGDYDVLVNLVDATHIERSLSLTTELVLFKRKMVVAINMMDLAEKENIKIDIAKLEQRFGVPFVAISAATGHGIDELFSAIAKASFPSVKPYDENLNFAINKICENLSKIANQGSQLSSDKASNVANAANGFVALSLLQNDKVFLELYKDNEDLLQTVQKVKLNLKDAYQAATALGDKACGCGTNGQQGCCTASNTGDLEGLIAAERYQFIDSVVKDAVVKGGRKFDEISRKIDNIVTNRFLAIPIFALVVYMVYYLAVSTIGTMGTDYANDVIFGEYATNGANALMESIAAPAWLQGLVVDGIIGGVGAVLGFVPQMIVLFILLSLLEQSGYMTRVAFVLDRIFRHFGLSGRCFIPMVVATGCGVPAIMASNAIDNINEKRLTIITTTFMPCSAKLPILAMIAASFFPDSTLVAPGVYFLAIFSIIFTALVLKKGSAFNEEVSPFVLEMPNYTIPKLRNVIRSTYERCKAFVIKAGTVIFSTVVVIWFLSSFNFADGGLSQVEVNDSFLAAIGSAIAFIFIPLGFASWQASVAIFTGLLAKENVVGTLAVLLGLGEVAEDDPSLGAALQGEFATGSAALAFLAFNLFSTPCIAALGAMKRQLNNPRLFSFAVVYMLTFAYSLALVIYELGGLITKQVPFGPGTVVALVLVFIGIYLIARPGKKNRVSLRINVKQV